MAQINGRSFIAATLLWIAASFADARIVHAAPAADAARSSGITEHGPLLDGGTVFVPEFGTADADGHWIIEGMAWIRTSSWTRIRWRCSRGMTRSWSAVWRN